MGVYSTHDVVLYFYCTSTTRNPELTGRPSRVKKGIWICDLLLRPRPMSAYTVSLTTPSEGAARGSHLPVHVDRGAGDLSQAWSTQIRRSGDLREPRPSLFAAVDGPLRRLRERDGANVRNSGTTLITLAV